MYQMLDVSGDVIYVGKAKRLKRRVASYFNREHADVKTRVLVRLIHRIETIVTPTEADALVLEKQLARELQPRFNIQLKDDKNYPYLRLSKTDLYPRVELVREKTGRGYEYFGPYVSIGSSQALLRLIDRLFPIRDCRQRIDRVRTQRKCIKLDMGSCLGPCVDKTVSESYAAALAELRLFLKGKTRPVLRRLTQEMTELASRQAYEKAAIVRDQIAQIDAMGQRQIVQLDTSAYLHVWAVVEAEDYYYALVCQVIGGKLLYQNGFFRPKQEVATPHDFSQQVVMDFYAQALDRRYVLLCDASLNAQWGDFLDDLDALNLRVMVPQRGEKKALLDTVIQNARLALLRISKQAVERRDQDPVEALSLLATDLQLSQIPTKIWGFDISHLGGQDIVGSSVCFIDGVPDKAQYRHFAVRSVQKTSNDPKSLYEVVSRRLKLAMRSAESFAQLLLIDGGKGQLNFARKAVDELGLADRIDVVALAKRCEEVYSPHFEAPISLGARHPGLQILQSIRDESHRFALRYQRKKRSM